MREGNIVFTYHASKRSWVEVNLNEKQLKGSRGEKQHKLAQQKQDRPLKRNYKVPSFSRYPNTTCYVVGQQHGVP